MHKKSKSERTERAAVVAQAEILAAIQRTGNNIAEVMNSLQALGAKFGINVNFTLGYKKSGESGESRRSGIHGIHSDHVEDGQCQTQRKLQKKPQISKISKISSKNPEEITIPELAAMVADELGINEDCALDALETAFELLEEYSLILDIGDIGILAGHEVSEVNEVHGFFLNLGYFEINRIKFAYSKGTIMTETYRAAIPEYEKEPVHDDFCEAYNPCKACENFNTCGYCSRDEDEEEDEDIDDGDDSEYDDEE